MAYPERPQLTMAWPTERFPAPIDPRTPAGYTIRTYRPGDEQPFLELMGLMDFDPWDAAKLDYNMARILPEGWFFAVDDASGAIVATAMALHNYTGRHPFTGDVGWVACRVEHRGRGLGYAVTACVTNRFREAGYTQIILGTEYYRLPAIKTYLKLGYVPVIESEELAGMWDEVYAQLGLTPRPPLR